MAEPEPKKNIEDLVEKRLIEIFERDTVPTYEVFKVAIKFLDYKKHRESIIEISKMIDKIFKGFIVSLNKPYGTMTPVDLSPDNSPLVETDPTKL